MGLTQDPSYETHSPSGWGGEASRGAAHGRPAVAPLGGTQYSGKMYLRRVRLDGQGYDKHGVYFGLGPPLYWCSSAGGEIDFTFRSHNRASAVLHVRARYPHCKIRE